MVTTRLLFRVIGDSIDKSAFSILYQALPTRIRLQAQTLIISIIEPVAGGVAGVVLLLLSFNAIQLSYALLFVLAGWIVVVVMLSREYMRVLLQALTKSKPGEFSFSVVDGSSLTILEHGLKSPYPGVVRYALTVLEELEHESLPRFLRRALSHPEAAVRQDALARIERLGLTSLVRDVRLRLRFEPSIPVRADALRTLAALGQADELEEVAPYLNHADPQLRTGAMVGLLRSGGIEGILLAGEQLIKQVDSPNVADREFAAQVLGEVGISSFYRPLFKLLRDDRPPVRRAALTAAEKLKNPKLWPLVLENLASPAVRTGAVSALVAGGDSALPAIRDAFSQESRRRETLIRLARICGRIGGDGAGALLREQLDTPDNDVRYHVLASLSLCSYRAQNEQVAAIQQKVRAEIGIAAWLLAALVDIGNGKPVSLLRSALTHELRQNRARVFLLLSFIYESRPILQARDNLTHASKEKRAYALEVLDNTISSQKLRSQELKGQELKEIFFPLIDDDRTPAQRLERLDPVIPQARQSQNQRLREIVNRADESVSPWSRACALDALARLAGEAAEETLITALSASAPLVREAAIWNLAKLERHAYQVHIEALRLDPSPRVAEVARQVSVAGQAAPGSQNGDTFMLSTIEKVIILKSVSIFAETPDKVLAEVASVLEEIAVPDGETIFEKGDMGHHMYVIISGRVRIHDEARDVAYLGERNIFGELTVLDAEPRSASVTAVEDTQLFRLDQDVLYELMADHIEVARGIIRVLTRRLRTLESNVDETRPGPPEKETAPPKRDVLLGGILEKLTEED